MTNIRNDTFLSIYICIKVKVQIGFVHLSGVKGTNTGVYYINAEIEEVLSSEITIGHENSIINRGVTMGKIQVRPRLVGIGFKVSENLGTNVVVPFASN